MSSEEVKKVIASMTVGEDVLAFFPDVINCMQTDKLELKKLVYLYLMIYVKSQLDMAIMAVNRFRKDCEDSNPLIRLTNQANIAKVFSELKEYSTETSVDFVRKFVWAIYIYHLTNLDGTLHTEQIRTIQY